MRIIAVINQKGGVAKTTTTVNLATGLSRAGKRVLILDLDPQGNISTWFNKKSDKTTYDLLINSVHPAECIVTISPHLDIITSTSDLAKAELVLSGMNSRETILKRKMGPIESYDYVLIDCPPSVSLLNINALIYAHEAFIPVSTDFLALDALKKMQISIDEINDLFNHNIKITTVIPTLFDRRNKVCTDILNEIKKGYEDRVSPPIRVNSKLKEAPGKGKDIFEYAKNSRGAEDYMKLTQAVIASEYFN